MGKAKRYTKGTHVIVDFDDAGPQPCIITRGGHLDGWNRSKPIKLQIYFTVTTPDGRNRVVGASQVKIDLQYYREKRLKELLNG